MNYWKTLILLFIASPALADDEALMQCRQIDNTEERLACFDSYVDSRFLTVEQIKEESVVVTDITNNGNKLTITLENGQIWRQLDTKRFPLNVGDAVIIRSASFGSFKLAKESSSRSIRVKRLD